MVLLIDSPTSTTDRADRVLHGVFHLYWCIIYTLRTGILLSPGFDYPLSFKKGAGKRGQRAGAVGNADCGLMAAPGRSQTAVFFCWAGLGGAMRCSGHRANSIYNLIFARSRTPKRAKLVLWTSAVYVRVAL